jgi:hypothetical protein
MLTFRIGISVRTHYSVWLLRTLWACKVLVLFDWLRLFSLLILGLIQVLVVSMGINSIRNRYVVDRVMLFIVNCFTFGVIEVRMIVRLVEHSRLSFGNYCCSVAWERVRGTENRLWNEGEGFRFLLLLPDYSNFICVVH